MKVEQHNFESTQDELKAAHARKRRRLILQLRRNKNRQRLASIVPHNTLSNAILQSDDPPKNELKPNPKIPIIDLGINDSKTINEKISPAPDFQPSSTIPNIPMAVHTKEARKQKRYDPTIPMTKEEISSWRRNLRRVRNRQSAAASRMKTQAHLSFLELEVKRWKMKHAYAMTKVKEMEDRIKELESQGNAENDAYNNGADYGDGRYGGKEFLNNRASVFRNHVSPPSTSPLPERDELSHTVLPLYSYPPESHRVHEKQNHLDDNELRDFLLDTFDVSNNR